jgi:hypothetical protein
MGSDPAFQVAESGSEGLRAMWESLAQLGPFGWLGRLWFATLAQTQSARDQYRQAREDHAALKATQPYAAVLQAILGDPGLRLVDAEPALGEQVLVHAACFDATWIQLRGSALSQARYLRLYCASRFKPFRTAYTYDLAADQITRHPLPGGQWHREVPLLLW